MSLRALLGHRLAPLTSYSPKPATAIKLDANESAWPLPAAARRALAEALAEVDLNRYPDARATRLRELLAGRLGGAPEDLVVGVGSDEIICILLTALSEPRAGRQSAVVLSVDPSFVMYHHNAIVCGQRPVAVPLGPGFSLDVDAMTRAIETERPNLVFLASPNNPTGNAFDDEAICRVIEAASDALVVIDEAYAPFSGRTLVELVDRYENVALMGTLSKIGLAGARVGFCRLPSSIALDVDKARQPFNLSSLAIRAAELALTDLAPVLDAQVAQIIEERGRLVTALAARGDIEPLPTVANFVLVRVASDAVPWAERLREKGIAVRAFAGTAALQNYVRITVGTPEQNDALLAAI